MSVSYHRTVAFVSPEPVTNCSSKLIRRARKALTMQSIVRASVRSVGATGFEPATSCSRSRRATGLRYAPNTNIDLVENPHLNR
jgi:hypothetical protein